MRKRDHVSSCPPAQRYINVNNDMDEKDDPRRYGTRYRNERVKSRNLSEKKRRDQFNMLINELCSMVTSSNRKMDKSSVLRSAISFLRNHREMSVQQHNVEIQENWKPSFLSNEEFTHLMLEALDGFIMVFSCTGKILYTSESIASLLGYLPNDICSSVFDMIHECDRPSLYKLISSPTENILSIDVHMKRGPVHSHGSPSYELVRLLGSFHHWPSSSLEGSSMYNAECDSNSCSSICSPLSSATVDWPLCFVAMARLRMAQLLRIVSLSDEPKTEFTSRHSLEWTFLFLDHRAPPIIGYLPFEVLGTSGYDYCHVDDLESVAACHETLLQTGEGTSCFYRFLTKGQQWIWLQTRYFISYHQWSSKPEFVVCTNMVISNEHVQNDIRKQKKKQDAFCRKTSFPNQTPSAMHNRSACLSPTPSGSSLGSLSSDPSERCSVVTPCKLNPVLFTNHCNEDSVSQVVVTDKKFKPLSQVEQSIPTTIDPTSNVSEIATSQPENSPTVHVFLPQPTTSCVQPATPVPSFVTMATMPTPFFEVQAPAPLMSISTSGVECQTTPSSQPSIVINASQAQLQDYLRRRHQALQQQIMLQQEELRRVSEQLMLVQFIGPNNVPASSQFCQAPVISAYPPVPEENIHPIYNPGNVSQPSVASTERQELLEPHARVQQAVVSTSSYVNLQPSVPMTYTSQGMDYSLSPETCTITSSRGYAASSHSSQQSS